MEAAAAARICTTTAHACWDTHPPVTGFFFGTGLGNHDFANEQVGSTTLLFTYISLVTGH